MATIEQIDDKSHHLTSVKKLWRADSDTLGFLPDGAFVEYAAKRHILVALTGGECQGYLLYRTSDRVATIAHLCIAPAARGKALARKLVRHLSSITQHLDGLRLTCRRDFDVYRLWPKLGFSPIQEQPGRAVNGSETTRFWLGHGHADLFTHHTNKAKVVLDANVVIDIVDSDHEETRGLLADWIADSVTYFVTAEIFNDIDRSRDAVERRRRISEARLFQELTHCVEAFDHAEQLLNPIFSNKRTPQDESDFRHVVHAVAGGADALVTRDRGMQGKAEAIYAATGLRILRPAELVGQIDELLHEQEYQPFQIAGTKSIVRTKCNKVEDALIHALICPDEKHNQIRASLNRYISDPARFACYRICDKDGTVLAAYVVQHDEDCLCLPFIRMCSHRLAATLLRTILTGLIRRCVTEGKRGVRVVIGSKTEAIALACSDLGFVVTSDGYLKPNVAGAFLPNELEAKVAALAIQEPSLAPFVAVIRTSFDASTASELEHVFWPAKILHDALPTFIVPIRAEYAMELFDEGLADRNLFGAGVELALNPESVYYRSARPKVVSVPGRILWYVSKGKGNGPMAIRACSRIAEVQVGKPKPLFRQFQRFGIYEWKDVYETAKQNIDNDVMAIRFHDTELLRPIHWNTFQPILKSHAINTNLESPCRIGADVFAAIYAAAFNPPEAR